MKAAVVLFLSLLSLSQGFTVAYSGNVSLSNQDEFNFRASSLSSFNTLVYNGVFYKALAIGAGNGAISTDVLNAGVITQALLPPSAYVSYFNAGFNVSSNDPFKVSFAASKSMVATTYLKLEEVDVNGAVVDSSELKGLYTAGDSSLNGDLTFQTFKRFSLNYNFELTAIFSNKVGVLDLVGSPVITPKSLETVISISNWKYAKAENSLVLHIATGSLNLNVDGTASFAAGSGTEGVFVNLATQASIDGKTASVKVSGLSDIKSDGFGEPFLAGQLQAKYSGGATFNLVRVTFPAGANNIVYDPTIGAGANPPSSASTMGVLVVFLIALLF